MITVVLMERLFPTKGLKPAKYNLVKYRSQLVDALNDILPKYGITTYWRVCAFLATCGIETDYFKTTIEYASGANYEGRKDLGNTVKGDGRKFKGCSLIQTTGRYNFMRVVIRFVKKMTGITYSETNPKLLTEATRLGVNFIDHPEKLAEVRYAVEAACIFWQENDLNKFADAGRFQELNGIVNRGSAKKIALHLDKRVALYKKCQAAMPKSFTIEVEAENADSNYIGEVVPVVTVTTLPVTTEIDGIPVDKLQGGYDKISASFQNPAVSTVCKKAGFRLGGGLITVWSTTGGKIALILTGIVLISVIAGVGYAYRKQITLGYQIAKATIRKAWQGVFA